MKKLVLNKHFLEPKMPDIQFISIENISTVIIEKEAFVQTIVNVMINRVNNIEMQERSFSSCWGSVWMVNGNLTHINGNAMSSSDMMLWQNNHFKPHPRPESTPFQKVVIHQTIYINLFQKIDVINFTVPRSDGTGR